MVISDLAEEIKGLLDEANRHDSEMLWRRLNGWTAPRNALFAAAQWRVGSTSHCEDKDNFNTNITWNYHIFRKRLQDLHIQYILASSQSDAVLFNESGSDRRKDDSTLPRFLRRGGSFRPSLR